MIVAGFAIRGTTARRVLLRGIGPTLAQFSVANALPDTSLKLFDSKGGLISQNDDWTSSGDADVITTVTQAVGAFALPQHSGDSALLVNLAPGTYSAQLGAKTVSNGIGMIEVYEAP